MFAYRRENLTKLNSQHINTGAKENRTKLEHEQQPK